jgi:nanoRNase/pAp phosphatase (c-di-AMP/oligoRNAs hydrolase)
VFGACLALLIANMVRLSGATTAIAWLVTHEKAKEQIRLAARSSALMKP